MGPKLERKDCVRSGRRNPRMLTISLPSAAGQVTAIVACGLLGRFWLKVPHLDAVQMQDYRISWKAGRTALVIFAGLLVGMPLWATISGSPTISLLDGFYRSGALVFGGGHVVLPLLQASVVPPGVVSNA